jgi:hypothetical protein
MSEKQITSAPHGHVLTNAGVWSRDGARLVYDVRSARDGSLFDGARIETIDIHTGEIAVLYESKNDACCGVASFSPVQDRVVFILGPERPTVSWQYGMARRRGAMVNEDQPGIAINLDARNLVPPFTPGALRGGTHLHLFSPDGRIVVSTYHDVLLPPSQDHRNICVSVLHHPVTVPRLHARNQSGTAFSVLVTRTTSTPSPGSDEIIRASEEAWLGREGNRIAFQGTVLTESGRQCAEVFVVDLPADLTIPGDGPLEGTLTERPAPPKGTVQRRITFTEKGLSGPRHWLRASPDGSQIGFLKKDDAGVVQFWTVPSSGGESRQITRFASVGVGSAFTWSADGECVAMVVGGAVGVVNVNDGAWRELAAAGASPVRPEACVFSPDGRRIAYVRQCVPFNQIFVVDVE